MNGSAHSGLRARPNQDIGPLYSVITFGSRQTEVHYNKILVSLSVSIANGLCVA